MCHKFCNSYEDAEEAVQDTFLIAYKKSTDLQFETFTAYLAYLRKVAIHESFRKRKANNRRQEHFISTDKLPEDYNELNEDFLPEEALSNKERNIELMGMIDSLSKLQNEMIYMYYFADLSAAEIADLMDCTTASVYNTLSRGRQTLKAKLEGKEKKKYVVMALVPLSALFLVQETAFAATYLPATAPSIANMAIAETAGTVARTAAKTKGYIITTCVLTAGVVATVLYFASQPTVDNYPTYEPYEPVYEAYVPYEAEYDYTEEPLEEIEPMPPPVEEEPEQEPEEIIEDVPEEPEVVEEPTPPAEPHIEPPTVQEEPQTEDEPYEPTQEEPEVEEPEEEMEYEEPEVVETPEPPQAPPISILLEPIDEPEPIEEPEQEPVEDPEPYEPYDPEPIHIDRTAEILAALAIANNAQDVNRIISYFNFTFERQMFGSMDERFRFYVTNEGSGDILIGMAALEDGTGWRMRFEHYADGQIPSSASDLLRWMD